MDIYWVYSMSLAFAGLCQASRGQQQHSKVNRKVLTILQPIQAAGPHRATVPGHALCLIMWPVVVEVCDDVQPDHVDPVGHDVQVEHGEGPHCHSGGSQDGQGPLQEVVGGLDLHQ